MSSNLFHKVEKRRKRKSLIKELETRDGMVVAESNVLTILLPSDFRVCRILLILGTSTFFKI